MSKLSLQYLGLSGRPEVPEFLNRFKRREKDYLYLHSGGLVDGAFNHWMVTTRGRQVILDRPERRVKIVKSPSVSVPSDISENNIIDKMLLAQILQ